MPLSTDAIEEVKLDQPQFLLVALCGIAVAVIVNVEPTTRVVLGGLSLIPSKGMSFLQDVKVSDSATVMVATKVSVFFIMIFPFLHCKDTNNSRHYQIFYGSLQRFYINFAFELRTKS